MPVKARPVATQALTTAFVFVFSSALALESPTPGTPSPGAQVVVAADTGSAQRAAVEQDLVLLRSKLKGIPWQLTTGYSAAASVLTRQLKTAATEAELQPLAERARLLRAHADAMAANRRERRSKTGARAAEQALIDHHQLSGKVVVVSLLEQVSRLYEDKELVASLPVVTGRPTLPTPPGLWRVQKKRAPFRFVSLSPPGDPDYYPPSDVKFAIEFRKYFYLHDAPWRSVFGAGANLPHADETSPGFSDVGTHGCINLSEADARKLYRWAELETPIIIY